MRKCGVCPHVAVFFDKRRDEVDRPRRVWRSWTILHTQILSCHERLILTALALRAFLLGSDWASESNDSSFELTPTPSITYGKRCRNEILKDRETSESATELLVRSTGSRMSCISWTRAEVIGFGSFLV